MRELTFDGLSPDGTRLVLAGKDGQRYTVVIDERVEAAVRRDRARMSQVEIEQSGLLRPREIPEGWGLLEALRDDSRRAGSADAEPVPVRETVPAPPLASRQDRRDRFVRAMAIAASRAAYGHLASRAAPYTGIRPPDPDPTLPLKPR